MTLPYGFVKAKLTSDPVLTHAPHRNELQYHLHLSFSARRIAAGVVHHDIAAGLFDRKQHSVPLPKSVSELDDSKNRKKQYGGNQCRFYCRRPFVLAAFSVSPTLYDDCHLIGCERSCLR